MSYAQWPVSTLAVLCGLLVSAGGGALSANAIAEPAARIWAVAFFAVLGTVWIISELVQANAKETEAAALRSKVRSLVDRERARAEVEAEKWKYRKELFAERVDASPYCIEPPGTVLRRTLTLADELDALNQVCVLEMSEHPVKSPLLLETLSEVFGEKHRREAVRCSDELERRIKKLQAPLSETASSAERSEPVDECLSEGRLGRGVLTEVAAYLRCLAELYAELYEKTEREVEPAMPL